MPRSPTCDLPAYRGNGIAIDAGVPSVEVVLALLHRDPGQLQIRYEDEGEAWLVGSDEVSAALKVSREVVAGAVRTDSRVLESAGAAMRDDREIVLLAVAGRRGEAFCLASDRLRGDKEIAILAASKVAEPQRQLPPSPSQTSNSGVFRQTPSF